MLYMATRRGKILKVTVYAWYRMTTLEVRMRDKMEFFAHRKKVTLPQLQEQLEAAKAALDSIRFDKNSNKWYEQHDLIQELTREVDDIASDREQNEYLLDIIPFVKAVYCNGHHLPEEQHDSLPAAPEPASDILPLSLQGTVHVGKGHKHGSLYAEYMSNVEKVHTPSQNKPTCSTIDTCPACGSDDVVDDTAGSQMICKTCAVSSTYMGNTRANLTYEQDCDREHTRTFSYKKISRFTEIISQFQARQNVDIPDEVIGQLQAELKKLRLTKRSDITPKRVHTLLKKLEMQQYYSSRVHICKLLGGEAPPTLTPELEDKLRRMFLQTLDPFEKIRKANNIVKGRTNFCSYPYVIYKMMEMLGKTEYLQYFSLLKSTDKLYNQDRLWKAICTELNWKFVKTV